MKETEKSDAILDHSKENRIQITLKRRTKNVCMEKRI